MKEEIIIKELTSIQNRKGVVGQEEIGGIGVCILQIIAFHHFIQLLSSVKGCDSETRRNLHATVSEYEVIYGG